MKRSRQLKYPLNVPVHVHIYWIGLEGRKQMLLFWVPIMYLSAHYKGEI